MLYKNCCENSKSSWKGHSPREENRKQNENLWGKDDRMQHWLKFSKEQHWAVTGAANESSGKIRRSPTQRARENAWTAARWNLSQRGMAGKDSRQIPVFSKKPWKPPPSSLPSCHPYSGSTAVFLLLLTKRRASPHTHPFNHASRSENKWLTLCWDHVGRMKNTKMTV